MEAELYLLADVKKIVGQKIKFLEKIFLSPIPTENPATRYKDSRDQRILVEKDRQHLWVFKRAKEMNNAGYKNRQSIQNL